MPLTSKNSSHNYRPNTSNKNTYQPFSKKILIEQTTVLLVIVFIIFKTVLAVWPENVVLPLLHTIFFTLPSMLKDHPAFLGFLLSFLTWNVMYLDSETPGINPPTPLSPTKYRAASGADFHINYMFALAVGPMVSLMLYIGWI